MNNNDQNLYSQTILILEPDSPTLNLYGGLLSRDYRVIASSMLPHTIEVLNTVQIHLLIVEPMTFGNERWTLLRDLITQHPKVPVLICTSLDNRDHGMKSGATSYLIKPVLPTTLLEVTKSILRQ